MTRNCKDLLRAINMNYIKNVILFADDEHQKLIDEKGRTVIHLALKWPDILEYILPKMHEYVNTKDHKGNTPLHHISKLYGVKQLPICEILFKIKEELDLKLDLNVRNDLGETPLLYSIRKNMCPEYSLYLIKQGADIFISNNDLETPLHLSAGSFRLEPLKTLIDRGAKNSLNIRGEDVLYYAMTKCLKEEKILYLLENEEIVMNSVGMEYKYGDNLLHIAVVSEGINVIRKILEKKLGVDVNKRNHFGQTPLHMLMEYVADSSWVCDEDMEKYIEIIKCLIEYGAYISIRDNPTKGFPDGRTPAEYVNINDDYSVKIAKFLNEWQDLPS